ncbi:hypothetical protein [Microcoleus vaginatus]|uniref:hypothetical protein n=1 Tax=Microcoleus vaginatus TaxID=119532 RepID=UPI001F616502
MPVPQSNLTLVEQASATGKMQVVSSATGKMPVPQSNLTLVEQASCLFIIASCLFHNQI